MARLYMLYDYNVRSLSHAYLSVRKFAGLLVCEIAVTINEDPIRRELNIAYCVLTFFNCRD